MKEWSNQAKYNSFNSYKGLTHYEHFNKIIGWFEGRNDLPPPIEASLDPFNGCNSQCYYCNSRRYLWERPAQLKAWDKDMFQETLIRLAKWGVKAFCWGGGGEATLNRNLAGMTQFGVDLGMEAAIITNAVSLRNSLKDELLLCRWIGISLDSARPNIYKEVRRSDACPTVLKNIAYLVKHRKRTDICVKVLVLPETIDSLLYTCQTARELGVQHFHARPVDLERKDFGVGLRLNLDMRRIADIFEACHKLETPQFHVFTVTHKYDEAFHVKHDFQRCLASPMVAQVCTDRRMYVCVDHRLEARFEITDWGSDGHRELLKSIDPSNECGRCTWSEYNRQIAECVMEDRLCRNFP